MFTQTTRLLFTMYLYWLYLKHLCYNPSSYACKCSFLVQAGAGLWEKCTGEPRAYSTSAVLPLPFVNMDPSKLSTMYTCILLAAEQRKKCVWYCTTIKFDLPLEKIREIVLIEGQLTLVSGVNKDRLFSHHSRVVLLASVAVNCNDALLLEKVPPVAKEQRLAVASVRTAVKVRDEGVFINANPVRW